MSAITYHDAPRPQAGTNLAALRAKTAAPAPAPVSIGFDTATGFELLQREAMMFAKSKLVPEQLKTVADCCIALNMAIRMKADPLMVMQNLYIVCGKPAWSAAFLIATFNKSGKYSALKYRMSGTNGKDDWGCQAYATELATGEEVSGPVITIGLAKAEGWYQKNGSKWRSMPELMLRYRAAAWMIRTVAPELSMGIQTQEEVLDTYDMEQTGDGKYSVTVEDLRQAEAEAKEEKPKPAAINEKVEEAVKVEAPKETETEAVQPDAPVQEPEPQNAAPTAGEQIKCPDTGKMVDDVQDCPNCPNRQGCPQWD